MRDKVVLNLSSFKNMLMKEPPFYRADIDHMKIVGLFLGSLQNKKKITELRLGRGKCFILWRLSIHGPSAKLFYSGREFFLYSFDWSYIHINSVRSSIHAVGMELVSPSPLSEWNSWVHIRICNFLEYFFKPITSKMSQTLTVCFQL